MPGRFAARGGRTARSHDDARVRHDITVRKVTLAAAIVMRQGLSLP
jgi:hypothetical protein